MAFSLSHNLITLTLFVLLPLATHACPCAPIPLTDHYARAGTVLEATVLSHTDATATLAVTALYKGCAPLSLLFFADTSSVAQACQIDLQPGQTWLLFLTPPAEDADPSDVFAIGACQGNRNTELLTSEDIAWLDVAAGLPQNQCGASTTAALLTTAPEPTVVP